MNRLIEMFKSYDAVYRIDSDTGFRIKFTRRSDNGFLITNAIYNSSTKNISIFDGDLYGLYNKSSITEKEELVSYLNDNSSINIDIIRVF